MLIIREVVKMRCEGMNPADIAIKLCVETKAVSSALCSYAAENGNQK